MDAALLVVSGMVDSVHAPCLAGVCRVHYRLAQYTTTLFRSMHAHLQSPERLQITALQKQKETEIHDLELELEELEAPAQSRR